MQMLNRGMINWKSSKAKAMPLSMPYISIGHNKNLIITLWNYF